MPTIGNTPRPGYVYDQETDTWIPIGVGPHTHSYVDLTLIDAKGDLLVGSAADTVSKLSVSDNGSTLVADSSATTGLRYTSGNPIGNPILNAACEIAQRGTASLASNAATNQFILDRWNVYRAVAGGTFSRQNTNDTTNLPNIRYCIRAQRDSGNTATNALVVVQNIETVNSIPFAGRTITMSFYARAGANYSPTSNALSVQLVQGLGTDQNALSGMTSSSAIINSSATLTTTWQRFTFTGTVGSTATQLAPYIYSVPTGTAGAADYFEITGVQIDVGSVALPFRTYAATLAGELAACYRYYFRYANGVAYGAMGMGVGATATTAIFALPLPTEMRVTPTAVEYSTLSIADQSNAGIAVTSVTLEGSQNNKQVAGIVANTASGITQYRPYMIRNNNSTSGYLGFTAEL